MVENIKRPRMTKNAFRELLNDSTPTIGTALHSTSPEMVEVVGYTELYDYVEFQAEYAPFDLYALENFCRAAELYSLGSMIKIDFEPKRFLAQRAIGAGFQSVLFADCRTIDDARACVRAVRPDTPEDGGEYGAANRRFAHIQGGTPEYVQALRDIVVVLMIEKKEAVDNLEEILSVPGIDMIQWGSGDYSMSIGRPGEMSSKRILEEEERVINTCLEKGIPPRGWLTNLDRARHYLDLGVRHFCVGTDVRIVHSWLRQQGEALRRILEDT